MTNSGNNQMGHGVDLGQLKHLKEMNQQVVQNLMIDISAKVYVKLLEDSNLKKITAGEIRELAALAKSSAVFLPEAWNMVNVEINDEDPLFVKDSTNEGS